MNHIKSLLMQKISNTHTKMWHLLLLLTIVWISPALLPEVIWQNYTIYIIATWVLLYIVLSRTIRTILRVTTHDAILIERFFILLSFLVTLVYGIFYGLRHGFDVFMAVWLGLTMIVTVLLTVGIVVHVRTSKKYYHGVNKDELFK